MMNFENKLKWVLLAPTITLLSAFTIYPVVYNTYISFYRYNIANPSRTAFVGFGNYQKMFTDYLFWLSLKNTLVFTGSTVFMEFVLGLGLALLISSTWGSRFFHSVLLIPMMLAGVAAALMWRLIYHPSFGVLNYLIGFVGIKPQRWIGSITQAMPSLIATSVWKWVPLMFLILCGGLQSIPQEPFEAAKVDGASTWQTFRYVTLPLLKPVILFALIYKTIITLRLFDLIYILTGGGPASSTETLGLYVYKNAFKFFADGYAGAVGLAMLALTGIIAIIFILSIKGKR